MDDPGPAVSRALRDADARRDSLQKSDFTPLSRMSSSDIESNAELVLAGLSVMLGHAVCPTGWSEIRKIAATLVRVSGDTCKAGSRACLQRILLNSLSACGR
jgi:hypothetical protein